jgi:hypothetical protein
MIVSKLWRVTAAFPKEPNERNHPVRAFLVVAATAEAARAEVTLHCSECGFGRPLWVADPVQSRTPALVQSYSMTTRELSIKRGDPAPPPPEPRVPRPSDRPLGETQVAVLRSLREHGKYPGGWVWNTPSGTVQVLEALWARCLVTKTPMKAAFGSTYEVYTIGPLGEKALAEAERADFEVRYGDQTSGPFRRAGR